MKVSPSNAHASKHLESADLQPPESTCAMCGGSARHTVARLQDAPRVELVRCETCAIDSASRMPTREALDAFYGGYYEVSEVAENVKFHGAQRLAKHIFEHVGNGLFERESFDLLDFGGGDGSVAIALAELLVSSTDKKAGVSVIDPCPVVAKSDNPRVSVRKLGGLEDLEGMRYTFVLASAVMEHIPEPRTPLLKLLQSVQTGGYFYARTPTVTALMKLAKMLGTEVDFTFPAHLHDMGQEFWERVPETLGIAGEFEITHSRPSLVATTFDREPVMTMLAYSLKAPWYLLGRRYKLVGGWEVVLNRKQAASGTVT